MSCVLVVDTETTGLPDFKAAADAPQQPHLVQLAWLLMDVTGRTIRAQADVVRPDGWVIPDEMAAIHGITTDFARLHGQLLDVVVERFEAGLRQATIVVAHNIHFDRRVLETAAWRSRSGAGSSIHRMRQTHEMQCTQAGNAKYVKPRKADGSGKFASLDESHEHWFDHPFRVAGRQHDALEDVIACARVWWALRRAS